MSAGVHAALVPEHLHESAALGAAFMLAVAALVAAVAALVSRPEDRAVAEVVAVLLAALIVSWAASRSTGIPALHPHPEAIDAVGAVTKLVEALGLACAIWQSQQPGGRRSPSIQEEPR
ncbi:MAG TPA: hypothetical protein VGV67_03400 [Solirubrobacteraceae bacterium]|nr:hypothetical protein [Solirubrobacteraceae bacterium]